VILETENKQNKPVNVLSYSMGYVKAKKIHKKESEELGLVLISDLISDMTRKDPFEKKTFE
jgi:hypothetical protein